MPAEQVHPELELSLVQPDPASKAPEQAESAFASNPETQVVAEDRTGSGCGDHEPDLEMMRGARVDRGGQEHGLAGEGDARALDRYEEQHGPIAVGSQQMVQVVGGEVNHRGSSRCARA